MDYEDDYPSCAETYSTLRIYPGNLSPEEVTDILEIEPTHTQKVGELARATSKRKVEVNGWFLTTKGNVESKDSRRHLDTVLEKLKGKGERLNLLRQKGARIDISSYWSSVQGHGGPTISPKQMRQLVDLDLEVWWDFY